MKTTLPITFPEEFILSGISAILCKTITTPYNRIRLTVSQADEFIHQNRLQKQFTGLVDVTKWIIKNQGLTALWRSNIINCIRYFPIQALNFSLKGQIKQYLYHHDKQPNNELLMKNIMIGALAGATSLIISHSLDNSRMRYANALKLDKTKRQFNGLVDVYRQTYQETGIKGLYRGFYISLVNICVYRGLYFGLYDTAMGKIIIDHHRGQITYFPISFVIGYFSTLVAGVVTHPIDIVRRRVMFYTFDKNSLSIGSSFGMAKQIYQREGGLHRFFVGVGAHVTRSIIGGGLLAVFDVARNLYVKRVYGEDYCVMW
jgi:solute carrier family 25 (adenine nucleotide translocator) protein 4/5/6/31